MRQYGLENIRNVVLLSHCGAGKTSLSEAILFTTGAITRLGKVNDGTTTSDYDPGEGKRIFQAWFDENLNLCRKAQAQAHAAIKEATCQKQME